MQILIDIFSDNGVNCLSATQVINKGVNTTIVSSLFATGNPCFTLFITITGSKVMYTVWKQMNEKERALEMCWGDKVDIIERLYDAEKNGYHDYL
jgi:hypothetical protein